MKIFLFDMDGVLLESRGYLLALQQTVRIMARALGFKDMALSPDDIAAFEAGGITDEWDEAAISTALLLETAWKIDPKRLLPDKLFMQIAPFPPDMTRPDFNSLARQLSSPDLHQLHPLERADLHFLKKDHLNKTQLQILHNLFEGAHDPQRSFPHRIFQELVLGSTEFAHAYGLPAQLECESYLLKHDISALSQPEHTSLRIWRSNPGNAVTVITSRPSRTPTGVFSTPEAELGVELVDLKDIPIVGWGGIIWLAEQLHYDPQTFVKPSPVHALAAMRVALGDEQETALLEAAKLVETGQIEPAWQRLAGAEVSIFEDTPDGIKSLKDAQKSLERSGIHISTSYFGIAKKPIKRKALLAHNVQVFPSLAKALNQAF